MRLVLDTHAAIWYLGPANQLSEKAIRTIRASVDSGSAVYVSAISLIETIYLVERGRLPIEALQRLNAAVSDPGFGLTVVPVDSAVAEATHKIPRQAVPDLPDRIIGATAVHLNASLITNDRQLQSAGISTIW